MDESAIKILLDSLESSRSSFEAWLFWATLLVVVGVVLEVVFVVWEYREDLYNFQQGIVHFQQGIMHPPGAPNIWMVVFSLLGAGLIALGVSGELYIGAKIGSVETAVRKANGDRATLLSKEAGDAKTSADDAAKSAQRAREQSDKAVTSASNASTLARGARQEADSFEKDIVSAKKLAADAESHLANALKQAADATAELNRIKSPRSLTHVPELIAALKPYEGTEYVFFRVFGDEESIGLLKQIDDVLQRAEWKRVQPLRPFPPAINIVNGGATLAVSQGVTTGVQISFESAESLLSLNSTPPEKLPLYMKAAGALNSNLASSLSPRQEDLGKNINVVSDSSEKFVLITVGKKP